MEDISCISCMRVQNVILALEIIKAMKVPSLKMSCKLNILKYTHIYVRVYS